MVDTFPVLYILMRNDLDSMNPGKAMAQASHASNAFIHNHGWYQETIVDGVKVSAKLVPKWKAQTKQGFGTVLVLAVNEHQMRFTVEAAKRYGLIADLVNDPTYPIRVDRDLTNYMMRPINDLEPFEIPNYPSGFQVPTWYDGFVTVPMDTCAYVFTDKNDPITNMLLGGYKLHP